jgi:hypothetical protein
MRSIIWLFEELRDAKHGKQIAPAGSTSLGHYGK